VVPKTNQPSTIKLIVEKGKVPITPSIQSVRGGGKDLFEPVQDFKSTMGATSIFDIQEEDNDEAYNNDI